uniref:Mediator of RNA polymerase II transcription subunit 20 n=2 Tax=Tanacetum cinerariifolium TaxID=118510 RepID=A0A6L2L6M2_TANCI|nr:mediator of RNA polymerase II transcription subunit 20A-like [Tanacetum cinerariifolium]
MPIKWILHWQPNAGHTVSGQLLAEISQCVESINGVKGPKWKSTLSFYRPVTKDQSNASEFPRDFLGISLPDQPNKYYFVLRTHRLVLEADSSIQTIMEKLQSYKTRVALNFEGVQYQLGDFQLRIGKVASIQSSESIRGIVLEMEYRPISSWEKSHKIMAEFFDIWQDVLAKRSFPGHFVHMEPNFADYGLSGEYTLQHTAVQYATLMLQMVSTSTAHHPLRN